MGYGDSALTARSSTRPEGLVCMALLGVLLWLCWPVAAARSPSTRTMNALVAARPHSRGPAPTKGAGPISAATRTFASLLVLGLETAHWQAR